MASGILAERSAIQQAQGRGTTAESLARHEFVQSVAEPENHSDWVGPVGA